jgi:hypothetical protein
VVGIRHQGEVKVFLRGELLLVFELVGADADDNGVELSELLTAVAETARLDRSACGQGFREKVEDDVLLPL